MDGKREVKDTNGSVDHLLDIDELSKKLAVPKNTLYDWVAFGRIPHLKLGKLIRFEAGAINDWLASKRVDTKEY